jgi:hypothetical protein
MSLLRNRLAMAVVACATTVCCAAGAAPASAQLPEDGVTVDISDLRVTVPIPLAADLCDIPVNVLSVHIEAGEADCEATPDSIATDGPGADGDPADQEGLINVNVSNITAQAPVALAAKTFDIDVDVLSTVIQLGQAECDATAESIASEGDGGDGATQSGLVNVNLSDITVQAPLAVAANLCDVSVNVLSLALTAPEAECDATAQSIASGAEGGDGANQEGLVNVNVSDVTVQAPVALAANVCDVTVNALVLAQLELGEAECDATAESFASGGNGDDGPNQSGLINVHIDNVIVQAPIAVAANICDVAVNVLASQVGLGETDCTATADSVATGDPDNQDGLINIDLFGITIQAPIEIAANVCDVTIALLTQQVNAGLPDCEADAATIITL